MVRKNNLEKSFGKGKIVFEDTDELDNYAGFVPDYSPNSTNNDEFDYYKPRSVTSYSKYKKGGKTSAGYVVPSRVKQINQDEVAEIFTKTTLKVKKPSSANEVNASYYLCSFSGKQIATLLNSWLIMNFTHLSVKEFEKKDVTSDENVQLKISGIKERLKESFGEINSILLDTIVTKYYYKYLDD